MKQVGLSYVVQEEDVGTTVAFKLGWLWWRKYVPIFITDNYVGKTGKQILGRV
jgi:hypothetical protein